MPNHATPRLSTGEEDYLRKFYDDAGSRGWSYQHYQKNHSQLLSAVSDGWPAKGLSHTYGDEDHLTRANFEADVHVFGHGKTVAQTLRLNTLLKDSANFEEFRDQASKLLTVFNERNLRTEFDTAKATANATANVLRAVASGAKFMRHRATMDTHTRPVHAALNGKVWRIDDPKNTAWRQWVVPLDFSCRCQSLFLSEADSADIITATEAERLLGQKEVERLKKDGFLQDRLDTKALFSSRQSYLAGLPNADQTSYSINSLTYAEHGLLPWKEVSQEGLSTYKAADKLSADALADFAATATDAIKAYRDYRGAPLFLQEAELSSQVKTTAGAEQYFNLGKVMVAPDEVYFARGDTMTNTYLKFYADDTVLSLEVEYSKDLPQSVKRWQQVPRAKIDATRRGLLIHKK